MSPDDHERAYERGYMQGSNAAYGKGRRDGDKEGYWKGFREVYKEEWETAREKTLASP